MQITATEIDPTPSGLRIGLRVEYSKDGPIRFVLLVMPWALFTRQLRGEMLAIFNRLHDDYLEHDPVLF